MFLLQSSNGRNYYDFHYKNHQRSPDDLPYPNLKIHCFFRPLDLQWTEVVFPFLNWQDFLRALLTALLYDHTSAIQCVMTCDAPLSVVMRHQTTRTIKLNGVWLNMQSDSQGV